MRPTIVIAVASMLEIIRSDAQKATGPAVAVQVCLRDLAGGDVVVRYQAQGLAARLYKGAGVTIDWSCKRTPGACWAPPIVIELSNDMRKTDHPGVLARAFPYEGAHILIYYDRIQHIGGPALWPPLLGHVLAHELMHVLQHTDQHSDRGVMKAHWTGHDYDEMLRKPLSFTDVDLIALRTAVSHRAACTDAAGNN